LRKSGIVGCHGYLLPVGHGAVVLLVRTAQLKEGDGDKADGRRCGTEGKLAEHGGRCIDAGAGGAKDTIGKIRGQQGGSPL
jgi:hypothetical protein